MIETVLLLLTILLILVLLLVCGLLVYMMIALKIWKTPRLWQASTPTPQDDLGEPEVYVRSPQLIGDDPVAAAAELKDQLDEKKLKEKEAQEKLIEEVVKASMNSYSDALTNTLNEIMYGVTKRKESDT